MASMRIKQQNLELSDILPSLRKKLIEPMDKDVELFFKKIVKTLIDFYENQIPGPENIILKKELFFNQYTNA